LSAKSDDRLYDWAGGAVPPSQFDIAKAAGFIGKSILIGITYLDAKGQPERKLSLHGVIQSATPEGVKVALRGEREGETWMMPPQLEFISSMQPGRYKLGESGEIVENPDLVAIWTIAKRRKAPDRA
jgi:hypothetical protein